MSQSSSRRHDRRQMQERNNQMLNQPNKNESQDRERGQMEQNDDVTQTQRPHDDTNNQGSSHSLNRDLKAPEMQDRGRDEEQDASVNVGEQLKDSSEQCRDDRTKKKKEKQRVTPPQRRHHGLINQGATCYLNSVLQVLFMTTEIHHRLDPQTDRELRQIFTDLKTKTCRTGNITRSLKIENVYEQRDAAECLQEILHHISPEASEVFQGQMRDTTKCSKDHIINEETNPLWTLPLSLRDTSDTTYSVESSFKRTFQTKTYTGDNMVYCNDCKQKTEATSRCEMVEAPQILILHLKRFDFDYNTRSHFKSHRCVEVPCELQLEDKTYKLYGMVNHKDSVRGGHYTATVLSEDNTWYECDDSHVSEVKHQLFAEDRTFSSSTVYLLMYRATELEMPCQTRQHKKDEVQTRNFNELFSHQPETEEVIAEGNLNSKPEGLKKTDQGYGRIKEWFTSVWSKCKNSPSKATECQKPEDQTDKVKEEQDNNIDPEEPKGHREPRINSKRNTGDEETTQMGRSAEDEGQTRKDKKKERLQAGGEEGDEEHVETDTSINNHATVSEVKSSEDEEAQENEDSNRQENSESEVLKTTLVEDASVDVGEQLKDFSEQHRDEETKTEKEEEGVTPPQRRHHGLINQGATCYLNSVLQVLFMTTEIHHRLDPQTDRELRQIFTDLKTKTCRTGNITRSLKIENVHEQRDAAECLQKILHHISPETSEVFQGQMRDTTKCSKDHIINEETNPFWTLPLSLKDTSDTTYSVESSFKRTFQIKTYTGDNMVYCNDCKQKTEATSRWEMVEAPQILILLLKRFDFDHNTRSHFKSHCCVEVPCELQLEDKTYKLYGMVNHMGSIRGGHYTATVLSEDNTWYECNDSHVSEVKEQQFAKARTFRSRTVYLLTYRVAQTQRRHHDPNSQGASHSLNRDLKDPEMQDRIRTTEEDASVNVGEQLKDSSEQRVGEETKTEREEQRVTPPQRRHHGLINQGATCYLNSVLQVLFMTTEIHHRLDPQKQTDLQLRKIFEGLKKRTCGTQNITTTFGIQNVHQQYDAFECLRHILHQISTEASEVFRGQLRDTTKCFKDHIINEETKTFWTLPLSLKDTSDTTYSVESSFERTFQTKTFSSGNMMYCNDCKQTTGVTSRWQMVEAPQILILLLKRFDSDYNTRSHFKSDRCVEVPCELQLENKTYKLYGMVNHKDSLRGGRYTATVLSNDKKSWYECDDSHVSKVKEQPFAKARTFSSKSVYLLMYRATEVEMSCKTRQNETKSNEETTTEREGRGVTPPQRRHHGLINQGATCYLNSVLQLLFMTTEIHDRLDPQTDRELRQIFTDLKTKTCRTGNITRSLKIENVHEQRDAAECLWKILHHISPEASEVFQGQMRETTKCSKDHIINEETNPFWTLPLSLKDSRYSTYSVESSFKRIFLEATYTGNKGFCKKCDQNSQTTSRCEMVEAPQILILLLKRFPFYYNTMSHFKSDRCVEVPCELQLKDKTYKLYGMVNHMGSIRGGHYTATVLSEDNTWYECDDSHVSEVKHQLFAEDRTFSSSTVYLLTYRATKLEISCEMRQNEEDETRNDNEVLNHLTAGEEDNTEGNSNDKSEGLKSTKPSKRHLDEETVTEKEEQRAPKKPHVITPPSQTDDAAERQDETRKVEDQRKAEVEDTRKDVEMDSDDEETRRMGHSDVVAQTQRRHDDPNNQGASHSLNRDLKDPEMQDRIRTTEEDASVTAGEQDNKTKSEKEEQRATECQKPDEAPSDDLTEFKEEQGEDTGPEELKGDEEHKRRTHDEETTQMGHGAEDEGQMREDRKEERLQAGGEEGDEEHEETDTSINNHTTVSEVKSSEDEEAQDNKDRDIEENNKSGELNETRVEDASVNVGEQLRDSSEQHLDEETKTEKEEEGATKLEMSCEMRQNEEDETRNDNEVLNHLTAGEEDNTEGNSNDKSEGLKSTKPSKRHLDEETATEKEEQRAPKKPHVITPPSQTDDAAERQDETRKVEDQMEAEVGDTREDVEMDSDDEETRQMGHSDVVTPPQRRHHGLINQGATCYLNSVLQVLFMTTEIHHRLDPQTDRELRQIFTDLKTKTCRTGNITRSLKIENVYEQRDAAECLQEILHHISPEASEVFRGQLRDTTKCSKDHIINEETNPFWTLPLSLKDTSDTTYSVESSFKRTFQTKTYSSGNMMYCNDCKQKTGATSRCEMVEAPQILILLLKRFDFDYITRSHFKSDCCVEVPCELQLETKTYKLYGMVNHMGSIRGGHYTATVLSEDNTWYECNDSHVSEVRHQLFAEDRTFSSSTVYLLTYRATKLEISCEMRQNEEDETRNDNEVLNHLTAGEEDNTEGNSNDKSEGLKSTEPSKRHLDEETVTEKEEQRAPKKPHVITPPSQTDDAAERQDETRKVEDQKKAEVEDTRKDVEMDTDDEETRRMGHSDVAAESLLSSETNELDDQRRDDVEPKRSSVESDDDDGNKGQIKQKDTDEGQETSDEALNSQTGGEEGTEETGQSVLDDKVGSQTEPVESDEVPKSEADDASVNADQHLDEGRDDRNTNISFWRRTLNFFGRPFCICSNSAEATSEDLTKEKKKKKKKKKKKTKNRRC
ncbi:uncharacterized protein AB9X84_015729 [Acanthopagrus schlegelii]